MTNTKLFSRKGRNQKKKVIVVGTKEKTGNTGRPKTKSNILFDMGKLQSGTITTATLGKLNETSESEDDETSESEDDEDDDDYRSQSPSPPLAPQTPLTISRLLVLLAETPLAVNVTTQKSNLQTTPTVEITEQEFSTNSRPNSQHVRKVEFSPGIPMHSLGIKKIEGKTKNKDVSTRKTRSPIGSRVSKNAEPIQRLRSRSRSGSLLNEIREMSLESQDAQEAKKKKKTSPDIDHFKKRRKRRRRREDDYTDLTRAAALTQGSRDLKQSLKAKKKRDRKMHVEIELLTKEEFFSAMLVVEASFHMKVKKQATIALKTLNKALKLQPSHKAALVARSQCHLNLGDAASALKDAQTSFDSDELYIQGHFLFAEALYQLGQFEKALIAYHQGNRLRKDECFRLGIRKSQEAIRKAIGDRSATHIANLDEILPAINEMETASKSISSNYKKDGRSSKSGARARWIARELLRQMYCDKDYLVKFLERPGVKNGDSGSNALRDSATEALNYLEIREQFWRQQNPIYSRKTNIPLRLKKNPGQIGAPSKV